MTRSKSRDESKSAGYFPLNLQLEGRSCLVVGGGSVALRKVQNLLDFGGTVRVVAPDFCSEIEALSARGRVELVRRAYEPGEAARHDLVIAAVDDRAVNQCVFDDCRAASVLVNVVDDPERCDFILSGTVRRGPLVISVGTQGTAPFFARWVREQLEATLPAYWEKVALLAEDFRRRVQSDGTLTFEKKKELFKRFTDTDWKELIDDRDGAAAVLERLLSKDGPHDSAP